MKKLSLVVSIVFAASIIPFAPSAHRQKFEMPVGKIALPIDNSVDNWCVVTESSRTFSKEVLL
jgi:hypothetical protein